MSVGRCYAAGVAVVCLISVAMVAIAPAEFRVQVGWAALIGLVLQAPLGWLVVRSVGTDRFTVIWGLGLLARLGTLAIAGFGVIPLLGWRLEPTLGALVIVLVALLFVEGITAWQEQSGTGERRP